MIEKNGSNWELCEWKVIHKSHGNKQIHYTNDRDYWRDTIEKHDHLTDLGFEEIDFTSEQKQRLEELNGNDVSESYMGMAREKVRKGIPSHDIASESDVVTEYRIRGAKQRIKQGEMELEDVEKKYRDKVRQRRKREGW